MNRSGTVDPLTPEDGVSALFAKAWEEPGNLDAVKQRILAAARETFDADLCTIFSLNPVTEAFTEQPRLVGSLWHPERVELDLPRPDGLTRHVLKFHRLLVKDLAAHPQWRSAFTDREEIVAFAAVTLKPHARPKPFAVLYIDYRKAQRFDRAFRRRLRQFAEQASAILHSTWLLHRYRRVMELGREINEEIENEESLFERLARYVTTIFDTSYFLLLAVYSQQTKTLDLYGQYRGEPLRLKRQPLSGACRRVIRDRRPLVTNHYSKDTTGLALELVDLDVNDPTVPESLIFVPLLVGDVPLGVLSIQNLAPGAYDDEAQHTLQLIANHVASALSNIRLFTDLDLLSKTGELLTGQLTAEEVLQRVVTRIQEATGCEIVVLYPYHRESDAFDLPPVTAGVLLEPDFPQPISCRRGDLPYRAVAIPEGVFLEDAAAYHGPLGIPAGPPSAFQLREKVVSLVLQPLRVGGEAVGALYLNYRNRQSFRGAQKRLIQSLAIFAAIAIKNAWAFSDQGRRRERELEVLRTIDQKLNRSVSLHEVLKTILVEANGIIEADHATILLLDEQGQLRFRAHLNMPPQDTGTGIIRLAFEQKRPVLVDDVASPPWSDRYVEAYPGTVSELDVPLLDGTAAVGVLNFESSRPNAFDKADLDFAETLAGQAVLAITKAQTYETLLELSHKMVRSALDEVLRTVVGSAAELTGSAFVDLDRFEQGRPVRTHSYSPQAPGGRPETRSRELPGSYPPDLPRGIMRHVAESKAPYLTEGDAQDDPYYAGSGDLHSELCVPLLDEEDELLGVLSVKHTDTAAFDRRSQDLLSLFANQAVIAIQNASSHESARRELARFEALWEAGQHLAELREVPQTEQACLTVAEKGSTKRDCRVVVRVYDEKKGELLLMADKGPWPARGAYDRIEMKGSLGEYVWRTRAPVLVEDVQNREIELPELHLRDPQTRSLLIAPILLVESFYGYLSLSHRLPFYFDAEDKKLAEGLAKLLAITFQRMASIKSERDLQRKHKESMLMSWIGHVAFDLAHRLTDLRLIHPHVNTVREAMRRNDFADPVVDESLTKVTGIMQVFLDLGDKLRQVAKSFIHEDPIQIPVAVLLEEVKERFRDLQPPHRLDIDPIAQPCRVKVNRSQIVDILVNLIDNACKAMKEGGAITIRTEAESRHVRLAVSDSGEGIDSSLHEKIFRLFYSATGSSGFGLWSAQFKAELNGGILEVRSTRGQGATFILTLPRDDQPLEVEFGGQ